MYGNKEEVTMKKIAMLVILSALMITLIGCGTSKNKVENDTSEKITVNYENEIKKLTDKEVFKMVVDDFDEDGEEEAFALTKGKQNGDESEFELWFLNSKESKKLADAFIATSDTSIETINPGHKYVLFNEVQVRQNDEMKTIIYGVEKNQAVELYSKNRINLFVENNELYAYNYSYYELQSDFKDWMSLSQQKYHFKWDDKSKTCKEYEAKEISEEEFFKMSNAKEVKEKIDNEIKNKYSKTLENVKYTYLLREDDTVDVNMLVELKDKSQYKYYVTVSCKDNTLETDVNILEGNKELKLNN